MRDAPGRVARTDGVLYEPPVTSKKKNKAAVEWVAGLVALPADVHSTGEAPFRPEELVWLDARGVVLGMSVEAPSESLSKRIEESFENATRTPLAGRPHVPSRVRVASAELADAIRPVLPRTIEVVCAPTPELDEMRESMAAFFEARGPDASPTYLVPGVDRSTLDEFFRTSDRLFRAAPWKLASDDPVYVTIEARGITRAVISIIGNAGQELGFLRFGSLDDYDAFIDAAEAFRADERPVIPPHVALNFDAPRSVALRDEVARHGWPIANAKAYPSILAVDPDFKLRTPTGDEFETMTAIAAALATLVESHGELAVRFFHGQDAAVSIETPSGSVVFEDAYAVADEGVFADADSGSFDPMVERRNRYGELDPVWRDRSKQALGELFASSPEAEALGEESGWSTAFMDFLAGYCDASVATMTPSNVREVVFEIFPRKMSCEASEAGAIVDELRAFLAFVGREFGHAKAAACLRVLDGDASKRLERELANPANFGMAKSFFMGGLDAGFDMGTKQGVDAWMTRLNAGGGLPPTPPRAASKKVDRAKKAKRKAANASRRKNR